ncbi:MAG: tRNA delta(2)-isopentenylpyrophosphate transferase [uncultured bacterium]|nr:MAG: tRNA delta(2)-isopentenylpyrophosphate transferase [uncultured bacterium]
MSQVKLNHVLVVCGPTASGKSGLACDLALKFNGEIINADSRQIYKELSIGVDKPAADQRKLVPHHLYDIVSLREHFNVAKYVSLADAVVEDVVSRGKLPIFVGGTGLYLRAFLFGLFDTVPVDESVRLRLKERQEQYGLTFLHEELKIKDPAASERIHPHDSVRILRALEIFETTGKTISDWQTAHGFQKARYEYTKLAYSIPREILYRQINQRVLEMMAQGLQKEVEELYQSFPNNEVLLKTIGYAQWQDYFKGLQSLDRTIELIQQDSRKFAKRQLTWFNKEKDINWFKPAEGEKILTFVLKMI